MRLQMGADETATEESDQTGDSGMGTGSGTSKYGTVEEWKKNLLPGMCKALHTPVYFEDCFTDTRGHRYQSQSTETGIGIFVAKCTWNYLITFLQMNPRM